MCLGVTIGLDDWIYWHLIHTTRNYRQLQHYCWFPHYKSLGHAESSQSSLVVSWKRIYNSLTVTITHMKSSFHIIISFFPSILKHLRLSSQDTPSILIPSGLGSSLYSLGADPQKTPSPINSPTVIEACLLCRCIETAILRLLFAYSLPREFAVSLPSNGRLLWFHCFGFQASCHNIFGQFCCQYVASGGRIMNEWLPGKDLERSDRGLLETQSGNFAGKTEKNH
jgi:hypothetical protein